MYRDVVTVAKSLFRYSMVHPSVHLLYMINRLSSRVSKMMVDSQGFHGTRFLRIRLDNDLTLGVFMSAIATRHYLDARRRGLDVSAVRYEDLVARPLDMCRVIMEFCHLPVSLAELAITAFDVDSQRNSIGAQAIIGHFREPQLTTHTKAQLNDLLKQFEVPLIGEPDIIEGTLTCS